jgi:hypothetical protein
LLGEQGGSGICLRERGEAGGSENCLREQGLAAVEFACGIRGF